MQNGDSEMLELLSPANVTNPPLRLKALTQEAD